MTVDTGSLVSFLSWTTVKQISDFSQKTTFGLAENQKLLAQFVDYNKHSIVILGILKADIRSAGWKVRNAALLMTERVGISTTQKPAQKERSSFDVLLCEQSEGWKRKFYSSHKDLCDRQGRSINHLVNTKLKNHCVSFKKRAGESRYIYKIKLKKDWKRFW